MSGKTAAEVAAEGQEPPSGADFPSGRDEATWWPIWCGLGVTGIYLGAGLFFFGNGDVSLIPSYLGPVVFILSAMVFFSGLFGWLYHGFIIDYWTRGVGEREPLALRGGMLLFLTTDIATFSVGFIYYAFIRSGPWPPGILPDLLTSTLIINTVALVASSFTLHYAHKGLEQGKRRWFLGLLGVTIGLGVIFVFGQIYEFYDFIEQGFDLKSGLFGSAFFGLTGLHGLHVLLGTILLGIVFVRGLLGQYDGERDTSVVTVSLYWHFVDVVWIFIIGLLYFGAAATHIHF